MTQIGEMSSPKGPAFEQDLQRIPTAAILPVKQLPITVPKGQKYVQIAASIREVGLIEPPVVARAPSQDGTFILLDGHVRLHVLKDMGEEVVTCLVATDDESFTYNKRISRLATIQEHKMILRAIERGVPEARIAAALNVDVALIRRKRTLLNGICPEAAELLKAKHCPLNSFRSLRQMKPLRQIQAAELMIAANNYTVAHAEAILAATDSGDLVDPESKKEPVGVPPEQAERMKAEMASLQKNIKLIEATLGPDHLRLVVAGRYVERLLANDRLNRYLEKNHGEIVGELREIVASLTRHGPASEGPDTAVEKRGQELDDHGTPDPISAGTAGDAGLWAGSSAAMGMAANPRGAHQAGSNFRRPRGRASCGCVQFGSCRRRGHSVTPASRHICMGRSARLAARTASQLSDLLRIFFHAFVCTQPFRVAQMEDRMKRNCMTQKELADRWTIAHRTLERWRWAGEGPAYMKLGGRVVYRVSDIEAFEQEVIHSTAEQQITAS